MINHLTRTTSALLTRGRFLSLALLACLSCACAGGREEKKEEEDKKKSAQQQPSKLDSGTPPAMETSGSQGALGSSSGSRAILNRDGRTLKLLSAASSSPSQADWGRIVFDGASKERLSLEEALERVSGQAPGLEGVPIEHGELQTRP